MESAASLKIGNYDPAEATAQLQRTVASRRARTALLILAAPLVGATFLSKFAIPGLHVDGIGIGFPLIYLALACAAYTGDLLALEWSRLMAFCLMAGMLGASSALSSEHVSTTSILFLMMLHLPYVFNIQGSDRTRTAAIRVFLNIALIIGICGIVQYAAQSFVPTAWIFPIENLLPDSLRVTGFNMQIPLSYGSTVYRANGIFMQEPSFYSQLLAIAVITELVTLNRLWRAGLLAFAIVVSQSGTGLILLAVCMPILMIAYRRGDLLLGCMALLLVLILAGPLLHIDNLVGRVGEFGSTKSSGYERFVGGFHIFDVALGTDPIRALFGYGPGAYRDVVQRLGHPAAEMALFKIVIEFGVVGALSYFGFIFFCIFSARGPFVVRLALALCLFLNGAYNTFVHSLALSLIVWSSAISLPPIPLWAKTDREKKNNGNANNASHGAFATGST
ncbi:MAG: hypothetical protein JWL63_870 [Rhodocyclales bacterium]|nr:hypothetical protein [Rhodocyclales bacterium]